MVNSAESALGRAGRVKYRKVEQITRFRCADLARGFKGWLHGKVLPDYFARKSR